MKYCCLAAFAGVKVTWRLMSATAAEQIADSCSWVHHKRKKCFPGVRDAPRFTCGVTCNGGGLHAEHVPMGLLFTEESYHVQMSHIP